MCSIYSDKKNRQNLEIIENALLLVCFDDPLPASFNCSTLRRDVPEIVRGHVVDSRDETNMVHQMIHGGGSAANSANRWFDMTIQVRAPYTIKVITTVECYCTDLQSSVQYICWDLRLSTLVIMKITGTVRLYSLVDIYKCLEEKHYFYLQGSLKMEAAGTSEIFENIN